MLLIFQPLLTWFAFWWSLEGIQNKKKMQDKKTHHNQAKKSVFLWNLSRHLYLCRKANEKNIIRVFIFRCYFISLLCMNGLTLKNKMMFDNRDFSIRHGLKNSYLIKEKQCCSIAQKYLKWNFFIRKIFKIY